MKRTILYILTVLTVVSVVASGCAQITGAFQPTPTPAPAPGTPSPQTAAGKPWIGIFISNNSPGLKTRLNLSSDKGVVITRVADNSPAQQAGLKRGDVVTAVDGVAVSKVKDLTDKVSQARVGDKIAMTITRDGQEMKIEVTVGTAPTPSLPRIKNPKDILPQIKGLEGFTPPEILDRVLSTKVVLVDKDGKEITIEANKGTVRTITANSLTIIPTGKTVPLTFSISSTTLLQEGVRTIKIEDLKADDKVVVITVDGSTAAVVKGGQWWAPGLWGRWWMPLLFGRFGAHPGAPPAKEKGP